MKNNEIIQLIKGHNISLNDAKKLKRIYPYYEDREIAKIFNIKTSDIKALARKLSLSRDINDEEEDFEDCSSVV